jgi:hypothetical protein
MIMIDAWNHWSADRQIEPTIDSPPTSTDVSATGDEFTLGFTYEGYGMKYLEIVKDLLAPELRVWSESPVFDVPVTYSLHQNYPNPFQEKTIVEFEIPKSTAVKLRVFDILGRRVRVATDEMLPAGRHSREIDATGWSSGVYYYELSADDHRESRRMVVVSN